MKLKLKNTNFTNINTQFNVNDADINKILASIRIS